MNNSERFVNKPKALAAILEKRVRVAENGPQMPLPLPTPPTTPKPTEPTAFPTRRF